MDAPAGSMLRHLARLGRSRVIPIVLVVILGLTVTTLLTYRLHQWESQAQDAELQLSIEHHISALQRTLQSHVMALAAAQAFFNASGQVTRDEFATFVQALLARHPGLSAIAWAPLPGQQADPITVQYVEGATRPPLLEVGQDLRQSEQAQQAIRQALATGSLALAPPPPVVPPPPEVSPEVHPEAPPARPLQRPASPTIDPAATEVAPAPAAAAPAQRHATLVLVMPLSAAANDGDRNADADPQARYAGVLVAAVDLPVVVRTALHVVPTSRVRLVIYDITDGEERGVLLHGAPLNPASADPQKRTARVIDRRWLIVCAPTAGGSAPATTQAWIALALGLAFTILLAAYLTAITGRTAQVERLVRQRTRELGEAHAEIQQQALQQKLTELTLQAGEQQMRIAREIQFGLYPAGAPQIEGFDIAGATFTALEVGGDYYDYLRMGDGRWTIAIGDASGHGVGPALLMAETRACLRALATQHDQLDKILQRANRILSDGMRENRFVTLLLIQLDSNARQITYANAGHPTAYVLDSAGSIRHTLESTGLPLAVMGEGAFARSGPIDLQSGDLLLLLTDGVQEACNRDSSFFGTDRAITEVRRLRDLPARGIVEGLYESVRTFCADSDQRDDITVVVIKVT